MTKRNYLTAAFLAFIICLYLLANAVTSGNRPPQPTPTPPAPLVWRVTDTAGETFTYPESEGWYCVGGGMRDGAFLVGCQQRSATGRDLARVDLVAVRLEHVAEAEVTP